jgi:hypothetical protein
MKEPTSIKSNFITAHPLPAISGCCAYNKVGSVLEKEKIKKIYIYCIYKFLLEIYKNERSSRAER